MPEKIKHILKKILKENLVELQGLSHSSKALILSLLHHKEINSKKEPFPIIIVCESFDIAEILFRDISYFLGKADVHFFPYWDVLPYDNFSPHKSLVAQRFKTLDALINNKVKVLITTPNAMMQRLLSRETFKQNIIYLNNKFQGSLINIQNQLVISGYNLVDVVEDQGEFSVHGLIVDIFPINMKKPVRIELANEKINLYIKPFDIQSQRTIGKELLSIKVLPANEIIFDPKSVNFARKKLHSLSKDCSPEVLSHLKTILKKNEIFPGIESLSPLFYSKLETLFDYFPTKNLIIIDNEKNVENRADNFFKEVFMEYELSTKQNKISLSPDSLFLSNRELKTNLLKNASVFLNSKNNYTNCENRNH